MLLIQQVGKFSDARLIGRGAHIGDIVRNNIDAGLLGGHSSGSNSKSVHPEGPLAKLN